MPDGLDSTEVHIGSVSDANSSFSSKLKRYPSLASRPVSLTPMSPTRATYSTTHTPEQEHFPSHHDALVSPHGYVDNRQDGFESWRRTSRGFDGKRWRARLGESFLLGGRAREIVDANYGLLLITASQACLAMVNTAVKRLNSIDPPVSTLEIIWVRMTMTWICSIAAMFMTNIPDPIWGPKGVRSLLWLRGILGFFGLFGIYYSLEYLSLADATVLTFLAPMCTALAGAVLLGENFTRQQALAGLVSFAGVVLIARPAAIFGESLSAQTVDGKGLPVSAAQRMAAVGVALIGVLGASGAYTTIRAIGLRAHTLHSLAFFSLLSSMASSIGMLFSESPFVVPTEMVWIVCLSIIGILGFIGQLLLTLGLQHETAGRGTLALYTHIVFVIALEALVFGTVPSALSIVGTLMIIGSALYVVLTKKVGKPAEVGTGTEYDSSDADLEEGLLLNDTSHPGDEAGSISHVVFQADGDVDRTSERGDGVSRT